MSGKWKSAEARQRSINALLCSEGRDRRWRGKLPVPEKAHPIVRQIFQIMNAQQTTLREVAARAGIRWETVSEWRYRGNGQGPGLANVVAVLNAMDYEIRLHPIGNGKPGPKKKKLADSSSPVSTEPPTAMIVAGCAE